MLQSERSQIVSQFVAPEIAGVLRRRGLQPVMQRQRPEIAAIVCDLRGFTAFAATAEPDVVVDLLEGFCRQAGEISARFDATVKDHAGDGLLILVGASDAASGPGRAAARIGPVLMARFREAASQRHFPGPAIGIATGEASVGAIRGAGRLESVAVGNPVNLAARLCDRAGDGAVLCDPSTAAQLDDEDTESRGQVALKGFGDAVPAYRLIAPASV